VFAIQRLSDELDVKKKLVALVLQGLHAILRGWRVKQAVQHSQH
jgi:hypothetical protein